MAHAPKAWRALHRATISELAWRVRAKLLSAAFKAIA
jgi:hypothetical protein